MTSNNYITEKMHQKSTQAAQSEPNSTNVNLMDQLNSLQLERREASRRPTVFELAQIAVAMIPGAIWKDHVILEEDRKYDHPRAMSAEDCAMDVWERCRKEIISRIDASILLHRVKAFRGPEWQKTLRKEKFPMPFEQALMIIVGKTRKQGREDAFRGFIRFGLLKPNNDEFESSIDSRVEAKFKRLTAEGVSYGQLEDLKIQFDSWNAQRMQIRAKKAATARWAKLTQKK